MIEAGEDTGAVAHLHATAKLGQDLTPVVVRLPGRPTHSKGSALRVAVRGDAVHCFPAETGPRLSADTGSVRVDLRVAEQTVSADAPSPQDMATDHATKPLAKRTPACEGTPTD
ncbi:hypothetical protein AB0I51_21485 [Streptomyces sp. NPDC050549]|uniref:hypothetical protein n=1 Tax=Streptomyces sp. NPDC050549 TaxID=3155406 RepID=UPI00344905C4